MKDEEVINAVSTDDRIEALKTEFGNIISDAVEQGKDQITQQARDLADDEIAKLGMVMRGDGTYGPIDGQSYDGGEFAYEGELRSIGAMANYVLTEAWKPIVVTTNSAGEVDPKKVKEATTQFLMGSPLSLGDDDMILQAMTASLQKWHTDPHAQSLSRTVKVYTAGSGIEISSPNPKIHAELAEFWKVNNMPSRLKEAIPRRWITGEHYFRYQIGADGRIRIRDRTIPTEIAKIETHPEDMETRLAYGRSRPDSNGVMSTSDTTEGLDWFADIDYFTQEADDDFGMKSTQHPQLKDTDLMQMIKFGDSSSVRGYPSMFSVLRYLTYYEHFITDRIILNHERSKVVWVRKIKGNRGIEGGRAQSVPRSGQTLTETDRIEWKAMNAEIRADDVKEDARLIRLCISAGTGFPEHVIFQDASNEVYASIRTQDTPFAQTIMSEQQDWKWEIMKMLKVVLREKVNRGGMAKTFALPQFTMESYESMTERLTDMVKDGAEREDLLSELAGISKDAKTRTVRLATEDFPVDVKFPAMVQEDPLAMAQESEVLHRTGIASRHTLAAKHGLRHDEEIPRILAERKQLGEDEPPKPGLTKPKTKTDSKPAKSDTEEK